MPDALRRICCGAFSTDFKNYCYRQQLKWKDRIYCDNSTYRLKSGEKAEISLPAHGTLWLRAAVEGKALLRTSLETFELCGDGAFREYRLMENFTGEKFSAETDSKLKIDVFAVAEQGPVFFCDALSPHPKFSDGPLPDSRIIRYPGLPHAYGVRWDFASAFLSGGTRSMISTAFCFTKTAYTYRTSEHRTTRGKGLSSRHLPSADPRGGGDIADRLHDCRGRFGGRICGMSGISVRTYAGTTDDTLIPSNDNPRKRILLNAFRRNRNSRAPGCSSP